MIRASRLRCSFSCAITINVIKKHLTGEKMIEVKNGYRILFIGDSITDIKFNRKFDYKIHGRKVYALQVAKQLKKKYKNLKFFFRGIASNRTYHLYDRLTKDCINLKPDVIVMLIGVNDAWEHYVPEQYPPLLRPMKPHVKEIYRRLNAELPDVQLLVLLPFLIDSMPEKAPFHKVLDEYRQVLADMAVKNSADIIDLQEVFNKAQTEILPEKLAVDGVHPTNLGHKIISLEILKVLK